MKKLLLASFALLASVTFASAQTAKTGAAGHSRAKGSKTAAQAKVTSLKALQASEKNSATVAQPEVSLPAQKQN